MNFKEMGLFKFELQNWIKTEERHKEESEKRKHSRRIAKREKSWEVWETLYNGEEERASFC
jgi:hypothetical protein